MRGRIVHYNPGEGKGLIAAEGRQYAFRIDQWHSDIAPAINAAVEFAVEHERPTAIRHVSRLALASAALRRFLRLPPNPS